MEATGVLRVGESASALAYIKGRRGLSPRKVKLILLVCMLAAGIPVGAWASGSWLGAAISVEFAIVGLIIGAWIVQRLTPSTIRKALAQRGQSCDHDLTVRVTSDALIYNLGDLTMTARWPSVTDLYHTRKHWVFLVQSSAMVLPRRFFATDDSERDFILAATSQMAPAALARSPDATNFAA